MEIVEEIALNLPVKSLLRFRSVSKSWNAMISEVQFEKKHKRCGEQRLLISHSWFGSLTPASTRPLSSPSSNSAPFVCPFEYDDVFINLVLVASCSDMWCVLDPLHPCSLVVWNPSIATYRQLPPPLFEGLTHPYALSRFSFGMGFDSVADDYKILKISRSDRWCSAAELYSLRSNSWREVPSFPVKLEISGRGVFVAGALYWMSVWRMNYVIVSFDLLTEKIAESVQPPPFDPTAVEDLELAALKGNLCLCLSYYSAERFVLWEMQQSSWTKILEIHVPTALSISPSPSVNINVNFTPLHVYDNGRILIKAVTSDDARIFIYEDEETKAQLVWRSYGIRETATGLLYVESLVSPATF